jgi:hypothetical protein
MTTPTMPPKNSPAYSPHCLDPEKKVKGQSQKHCSLKTTYTEVRRLGLMFCFYILSLGHICLQNFADKLYTMEDCHIYFLILISLTMSDFHIPNFHKDFSIKMFYFRTNNHIPKFNLSLLLLSQSLCPVSLF